MPARNVDVDALVRGDRGAIARAITVVENDAPGSETLLRKVALHTGRGYRIGITGPPGAGKSTLTNGLAAFYRKEGKSVGIIAVDPTSPFTGGALLGDRVRMTDVEVDDGVFIRSMASRGSLGGLSKKAMEAGDVLDASGKDIIIYETVGVGQSELDIAGAADTTVVVLVPESGDSIQAMKAGLMEIADLFVMNKSDRAGAEQAVTAIRTILGFREHGDWLLEVIMAVGSEGKGIPEIARQVGLHREHLLSGDRLTRKRRRRMEERVRVLVAERLREEFWSEERNRILQERVGAVLTHATTPLDLVDELVDHFQKRQSGTF